MSKMSVLAAIAALALVTAAAADTPQPIALEPINHSEAELIIVRSDGTKQSYTPAELETLATYRVRTTTPWRDEPADFDGVLLSDLLAQSGLHLEDAIKVIAENEFSTIMPRALWETVPVLIATRVDGRAHTRRERGPIQVVIDMDDYTASPIAGEKHLVWMVARIEAE